ncbi:50S ribosomal protein L22 [Candidatus Gottesmanbacteria bacterium]|nr:50S ribosomal protein L22 [Candidatus Gottesmanbacteria bacterium]
MEYTATAKYIRTSPRKVRLVARAISGKKVSVALNALSETSKHASEPIVKLLKSAVANAVQKKAAVETLVVSAIDVMGGPALKRWHAVSKGSAHAFKKRMTHVKVVLTEESKKGN